MSERELTKQEWVVSLRQLLALRRFWKRDRTTVCGAAWIADYGPLPCDRAHGHAEMHRAYGSQGPIEWRTLNGRAL